MQIKMTPRVAVKTFEDFNEGGAWLEAFLHNENIKVFHILQSVHDGFRAAELTYTVVFAEMPEMSEEQKEAKEKIEKAMQDTQKAGA